MELSQSALARLYFYALILGVCLAALYDLLRITRVFLGVHYSRRAADRLQRIRLPLLSPHKKSTESRALGTVVFFEDLLFCVFSGVAFILLFYRANNGKIRFPVFICAAAGFLLYRGTLGRAVMLFSEVIAFGIETVVRYAAFFISYPFRMLFSWLVGRIRQIVKRGKERKQRAKRRRFTRMEDRRIAQNACGLLPEDMPKPVKLKRGKKLGKGKEKTVHAHASRARSSRRSDRRFHRGIRE